MTPQLTSLDEVKNNCNRHPRLAFIKDGEVRPFNCKSWSCLSCAPRRARRLKKAIIREAENLGLQRFLTLTLDPKDMLYPIMEIWRKFRVYLVRRGYNKGFIWVKEHHKSGILHLHVLLGAFIPQAWISEAWNALGGGKIVYIKYVDAQRIGAYLTKYLTKELLIEGFEPGERRYGCSRSIVLFEKAGDGWKVVVWLEYWGRGFWGTVSKADFYGGDHVAR